MDFIGQPALREKNRPESNFLGLTLEGQVVDLDRARFSRLN
jgi:hypothetical protein